MVPLTVVEEVNARPLLASAFLGHAPRYYSLYDACWCLSPARLHCTCYTYAVHTVPCLTLGTVSSVYTQLARHEDSNIRSQLCFYSQANFLKLYQDEILTNFVRMKSLQTVRIKYWQTLTGWNLDKLWQNEILTNFVRLKYWQTLSGFNLDKLCQDEILTHFVRVRSRQTVRIKSWQTLTGWNLDKLCQDEILTPSSLGFWEIVGIRK